MKTKMLGTLITLFFVLAFAAFPFTANAVVDWTKTSGNPVLIRGGSGSFDEVGLHRPVVIKDGSTYKMWYTGIDGYGTHSIGYATSSNGTSWIKAGQVFVKGAPGSWDGFHVGYAWIIKETSGTNPYKMWYSGTNDPAGQTNWQIGFAESANGIYWTRSSNPLALKGGAAYDWDGEGVAAPCVIKNGINYLMWYKGWNTSYPRTQGFGFASSSNYIINWSKSNSVGTPTNPFTNSDPVIKLGNPGAWDGFELASPSVILDGGVYRIWYDGSSADETTSGIGYAYYDVSYKKYDGNPVVMEGTGGSFDEDGPSDAMVLKDGNTYRMYYSGSRDCSTGCIDEIGYAESSAYSGSNPAINNVQVLTLNRSTGRLIVVGLDGVGPGPLDINAFYVQGPNNFYLPLTQLVYFGGQQLMTSGLNVNDFAPYAGTYTFTVTANNGTTASKTITFTSPAVIPYPEDGVSGFQRFIEQGGTPYAADNAYIGGTTPTIKWSPMTGHENKYYRVRVWDLRWSRCWFMSTPTLGTQAVGGFLSAAVPAGVLMSNTPYQYEIEVLDTDQIWSAHNRSVSAARKFYTGTKGTEFISDSNSWVYHFKSFRSGDQGITGLFVKNLAPWDISSVTPFQVTNGTNYTYDYIFSSPNYYDLGYSQMWQSEYGNNSIYTGTPTDGNYNFQISDGTNSDTASDAFTDDPSVPQVTRETMTPKDNSYLKTLEPTLSWRSFAGTGYKYRVRVGTWNNFLVWSSIWIPGTSSAGPMSVKVPANTLQPGPYRWYVEVQDIGNNTRTRSQYLAFMTDPQKKMTGLPWLQLLLGD